MAMEIDSCCVNAVSGPGVVGPSFGSEMLRICAWRASWTSNQRLLSCRAAALCFADAFSIAAFLAALY